MQKLNARSMRIIREDPYLEPYTDAIMGRYKYQFWKEHELTKETGSLSAMASGYEYFGLHCDRDHWYFREWAPNATRIVLIGTFNNWQEQDEYALTRLGDNGIWEIVLPKNKLHHLDLYKLKVYWNGGEGERIPAWADRTVQDEQTKIFSAHVWAPEHPYKFRYSQFVPQVDPLMIYECHIGMATNEEKVGTYEEFRVNVLPRVRRLGYTAIQIMAIQEHPYYGSFGYHVSNFFAASSRFGTPDELKH
ncbi:MAG: 1,4-alpha-glucan-branching enzyme, partial [Bacteroidales bacterium]|nr:1,4-alpha-glucan-branching enzyme [Bacteroidales bacterium]